LSAENPPAVSFFIANTRDLLALNTNLASVAEPLWINYNPAKVLVLGLNVILLLKNTFPVSLVAFIPAVPNKSG
jgi:hypothetical protein